MRARLQSLLPSVLVLALASLLVMPLLAVAQGPTLSMSPETARPGSTVEISGAGFPAGHVVELRLTTPDGSMPLASSVAGLEGEFQQLLALPLGTTKGDWEVLATAVDGTTSSLAFSTLPQTASAEAAPVAAPEPATAEERAGNTSGDIAVLLIIAVILGGIAFGGLLVFRQLREESPPGMGKGDDLIWGGGSAETPEQTATDEPHWKAGQSTPSAQTEG
ncbi:MAG: hypothetical protein AB1Z67_03405 [Candidatus Limnocylindrales bacterium]